MDPKVIRKLLVPNRGEIAIRVARTCRELGVVSVWAHSEGDAYCFPRHFFDETTSLGEGDARDTYLNVSKIVDAAKRSGVDAIHPGYGFLSERAELAGACEAAGIRFIGPVASSIELMGSKAAARARMERVGVPVVPGYHGDDQSDATLATRAKEIGLPLLVKASAGGGGKGMKIVRDDAGLAPALESARREAMKAFGNDGLLLERYIEESRHVEFQIFGDGKGNALHIFERDCSIQRRHQKIIEETPAPHYSADLRQRMARSAIDAARAVDYRSAGTVEFLVTPKGDYYFLEMNTRLQVEHPVTEMVLGVDLVRGQIELASSETLPWKQEDLRPRGHAIECRVYAENPDEGFLPQTGTIAAYREPAGPGIRVDSGVTAGSEITVQYDPLLSKVIAFAETRASAIDRLDRALAEYLILGTTTNVSYLRRVIGHPEFRAGHLSTLFVGRHEDSLRRDLPAEAVSIAAVLSTARRPERPAERSAAIPDIWDSLGKWDR